MYCLDDNDASNRNSGQSEAVSRRATYRMSDEEYRAKIASFTETELTK